MCFTRRDFCLLGGLLSARLLARAGSLPQRAPRAESRRYYEGFRVGLQCGSLPGLSIEQAIAKAKSLGLKYLELSPAQLDFERAALSETRAAHARLLDAGISTPSYGIVARSDEKKWKSTMERVFARAQEFGLRTVSLDADPDRLGEIDRLATRFRINAAVRNPEAGEFRRVEALYAVKSRLYDVYLSDVSAAGSACALGLGRLDVPGLFGALREQNYDGPVMVEYSGEAAESVIDASFEYLKKIAGSK
jgi:sugar phosphate isomerase/epimerase